LARTRRKEHATTDLDSLAAEPVADVPANALPESAAEAHDLHARVVAALAQLPFEQREAVVLRDLAGLSNQEVADALGVSLPAAKSRIHRGRLVLRDTLEPLEE
jgi:RNA polymerase sigma-70 factor (ECF subfamily)